MPFFTKKRKYITKRLRRKRILRGGDVDVEAENIISTLKSTYTRQQVIDFLTAVKNNTDFKTKIEEQNEQVKSLKQTLQINEKSTCDYMKLFSKFVNELLTTSINELRRMQDWTVVEVQTPPQPIQDFLQSTVVGVDKNNLMKAFVKQYRRALTEPCLKVTGVSFRKSGQGGRTRHNKNRRLRRTQKGGDLTAVLGVVAFIGFLCFMIAIKMVESRVNANDHQNKMNEILNTPVRSS